MASNVMWDRIFCWLAELDHYDWSDPAKLMLRVLLFDNNRFEYFVLVRPQTTLEYPDSPVLFVNEQFRSENIP
jgi:hypothetical protein